MGSGLPRGRAPSTTGTARGRRRGRTSAPPTRAGRVHERSARAIGSGRLGAIVAAKRSGQQGRTRREQTVEVVGLVETRRPRCGLGRPAVFVVAVDVRGSACSWPGAAGGSSSPTAAGSTTMVDTSADGSAIVSAVSNSWSPADSVAVLRRRRTGAGVAGEVSGRKSRGTGSRRSSSVQCRGTTIDSAWRRHSTPLDWYVSGRSVSSQKTRSSARMPYATDAGSEHPGRSQSLPICPRP